MKLAHLIQTILFCCGMIVIGGVVEGMALPSDSQQIIVDVNWEAVAHEIFPGSVLIPEEHITPMNCSTLTRLFRRSDEESTFSIEGHIYADSITASKALRQRVMYYATGRFLPFSEPIGDEHMLLEWLSAIRVNNVVVVMNLGKDIHRKRDMVKPFLVAVAAALHEPTVVKTGHAVTFPPIEIGKITPETRNPRFVEVLVRFPEQRPFCIEGEPVENGWYRVELLQESTWHLIWPNGLYQSISVEKMAATTNVGLTREAVALTAVPTPTPSISDADIQALMRRLRAREGDVFQQQDLMRPLIQAPTEEMLPFFVEIINSDRETTLKDFALQGLVRLKGASGLELYRTIAQDRRQDETIRQYALLAIGNYGNATDLQFVDELLVKEQSDWLTEVIEAVREQIQNRLSSQ